MRPGTTRANVNVASPSQRTTCSVIAVSVQTKAAPRAARITRERSVDAALAPAVRRKKVAKTTPVSAAKNVKKLATTAARSAGSAASSRQIWTTAEAPFHFKLGEKKGRSSVG